MSVLELRNIRKTFPNGKVAVDGINLSIDDGEIVSLLGSSGCGKTTTLRCVAGLEKPDSGEIVIAGKTVFASTGSWIPPERRGLSMVFQQYALWPHMNVFENVAFGLKAQRFSKADVARNVEQALKRMRLWAERDRRIRELSGGQQQRVALARAIAVQPKIVLFDEPLSNLDANLRDSMRTEILELHADLKFTALYVTHDQQEALSLSTRTVVMRDGLVEQDAAPSELWIRPASAFVASFIGTSTRLEGVLESRAGRWIVRTADGHQIEATDASGLPADTKVDVFLRTGAIETSLDQMQGPNVWKLPLHLRSFNGDFTTLRLGFGSTDLEVRRSGRPSQAEIDAEYIFARIDPTDVLCFAAGGEIQHED
jgi:ABC-type Fe3+/spermidine/putrescine transport system ATPase subunit